jgi:hypothetical protein
MATTFYFSTAYTNITSVATTGVTIRVTNVYRPLIKSYTQHRVEIPGRTGSWDFGGGVQRDYTISVDLALTASKSSNIMATAAAIATLLQGKKGSLIFSDTTSVTHTAQIYDEIRLVPEGPGVARATLNFECDAT